MPFKSEHCPCGAKSHKKHADSCIRSKSLLNKTFKPVKRETPPGPPKNTSTIIVIDTSASMNSHHKLPERVVNDQIQAVRGAPGGTKSIYTLEFDTMPKLVRSVYGSETYTGYKPVGNNTNIYAAFDVAYSLLEHSTSPKLLIFITDGLHNYGGGEERFKEQIREAQASGTWTLAFIGPPAAVGDLVSIGVPRGNIKVWDGTTAELDKSSVVTKRAIDVLYSGYSRGQTTTSTFFADAEVKDTKIVGKLPKLTGFVQHLVDKKSEIASFVKRVNGSYSVGDALYELTKPETVQSYKEIILQDRKTGDLLGGNVRAAIGIPAGKNGKVSPGNLKGFKVFVESTSTNRHLVPGTTVLVRK